MKRRLLRGVPVPIAVTLGVLAATLLLLALGETAAGTVLAAVWVIAVIVTTAVAMIRALARGHAGLDVLAVLAMTATLAVGEVVAALIIVLMLQGGAELERLAGRRARRDLAQLLDRAPRSAHVIDGAGAVRDVGVDEVQVGEVLLLRPSEIVPVDGVLVGAGGSFDLSSLTGESLPVALAAGDEVLSGAVNGERALRMRAIRPSRDSQYQQIVALVRAAESSRGPVVRLADRFAVPFTAVALVLAATAWMLSADATRFAEVLVLATPCPLLIAAPVAFLGGLSRAARAGVVVKGGATLEALARVRSAAFDKTGTLTLGRPRVTGVIPAAGFTADEVLALAGAAEQYSSHAFADGIRLAATARGLSLPEVTGAEEIATQGVCARIGEREVRVGKPGWVAEVAAPLEPVVLTAGETSAGVAVDTRPAGRLVLADALRPESAAVIGWMRAHGVERIAILTGDNTDTAAAIAAQLEVTEVHAQLLPGEKVDLAARMNPRPVLVVGDGLNDAPVLAAAEVGVAMGAKGATAAGDAADAVILTDSLSPVVEAIAIARRTVRVALTAIWVGIALSIGLMIVAMTGVIPAVAGALTQEAVDLAAILFALRSLTGPSAWR